MKKSSGRYNVTVGLSPRKFVWFRVAKCGTRSTFQVLRRIGVDFQLENGRNRNFVKSNYPDYFTFSFVRNPYSRIVSAWQNKVLNKSKGFDPSKVGLKKPHDFDEFVAWLSSQDPLSVNIHFRPQSLLVPRDVDFIGRHETFDQDLRFVLRELGVCWLGELPRENSRRSPKKSIPMSLQTYLLLNHLYAVDFDRFSYERL